MIASLPSEPSEPSEPSDPPAPPPPAPPPSEWAAQRDTTHLSPATKAALLRQLWSDQDEIAEALQHSLSSSCTPTSQSLADLAKLLAAGITYTYATRALLTLGDRPDA